MIKVYLKEERALGFTHIYFVDELVDGRRLTAKPINLEYVEEPYGSFVEPTMTFNYRDGNSFLQELASALIAAGYRDKATDTTAEVKRLENHLQDMRALVFKRERNRK